MKRLVILLIAVAAVAAVFVMQHGRTSASVPSSPSPTAAAAAVVTAQAPAMRRIPESLSVTGTISAQDELAVGAEVSGLRLVTVDVDEGMHVVAGQTLATLDSSVLEAQLHQARARLEESRASLGKAIQPNRPQDIAGLENALSQSRANLQQAQDSLRQAEASRRSSEQNLVRYKQLLDEDYATQQEYEDRVTQADKDRSGVRAAEDQVRAAQAAVSQAEDRVSLAHAGGRSEDVQYAHASTEEAAATVEQLEAELAQTVIRAPDDGLIIHRDAHLGDITSGGKALFTMVRKDELELRAQVPQGDLDRIRIGQSVELTSGHRKVSGRVRLITPAIDANTRLGTARIAVPTGAGLMPGMFVHAQLELGSTDAMVVPADAILGSAEQPFVFVLTGDEAHKRAVEVGQRFEDAVQITRGLTAKDSVIVAGAAFLTDGDTVKVSSK